MWVAKISVPYMESALLSNLCRKHKVKLFGYPVSAHVRKNDVEVVASGIIVGDSKKFLKDLVKDKRVLNVEVNNDYLVLRALQAIENKFLFQPGVIFTKPALTDSSGEYFFELGAWDRKKLTDVFNSYKNWGAKLHWIGRKSISNIHVLSPYPELTDKQRECFRLAVDSGYYDYPRGTELRKLAKLAKLSYSTYQFHLRNAEKKLMPFFRSVSIKN